MKRQCDWMFVNDTEDKPISIIITTYQLGLPVPEYGEAKYIDSLFNVVQNRGIL